MARRYANIFTAIWRDADFRALPIGPQHAYLKLITQPDISSCGLLPITLGRWANETAGMGIESLSVAIRELIERRYLVEDQATEELLVRSFARWDGGTKVPKRRMAVVAAAESIGSDALRLVMAHELDRLEVPHNITGKPIDIQSNAYRTDIDSPRVVVTEVVSSTTHNPNPQPTTHNPVPAPNRATRLPADWRPSPQLVEWVNSECPSVDGPMETAQFVDWWHARSGKDATKVDWDATYRNWMRRAEQRGPRPSGRSGQPGFTASTTEQRGMAAVEAARTIAATRATTDIGAITR